MIQRERILGWVTPIACMVLATLGVIWQHNRLAGAQADLDRARNQIIEETLDRQVHDGVDNEAYQVTSTSQVDGEEALFLATLRQKASAANVQLASWTAQVVPTGANAQNSMQPKNDLLKNVVPVSSQLTIDGSYENVRAFIASLEPAQPIYTFSDMTWSRTQYGTELKITITRYVETPPVTPVTVTQSDNAKGATRT